jgi:hypothetical protein
MSWAVCVSNEGHEASLEVRKLYVILKDDVSLHRGFVRVVDESGEDYLYPVGMFRVLNIESDLERVLLHAEAA